MTTSQMTIGTTPWERKAPWIGAGRSGSWADVWDALEACGLDFGVTRMKPEVTIEKGTGTPGVTTIGKKQLPNTWANVRMDTDEIVGVVSDRYKIVQNAEAFPKLLEPFMKKMRARIIAGGMTDQGLCFMVAETGRFMTSAGDMDMNVMVTNSFNGKYPLSLILSPTRIVCQNMYRGLTKNRDNVFRIIHSSSAYDSLNRFSGFGTCLHEGVIHVQNATARAQSVNMTSKDLERFVSIILPMPRFEEPNHPEQVQAARRRIEEEREKFLDTYFDAPDNRTFQDTRLGILNAYFDYMSHHVPNRKYQDPEGRRLGKIVDGSGVKYGLVKELTI